MLTIFVATLIAKAGFLVATTSPKLYIYPNESHIYAPANVPLTLVCEGKAEKGDFGEMKWTNKQGDFMYNVRKSDTTVNLTFSNPSVEDSGEYTCHMRYENYYADINEIKTVSVAVHFYRIDVCENRCSEDNTLRTYITAETEDEFKEDCRFILDDIQCKIHYKECLRPFATGDTKKLDDVIAHYRKTLAVYEKICSEGTLLNAAILDNLQCLSKLANKKINRHCYQWNVIENRVPKTYQALKEEGLMSLIEYQEKSFCVKKLEEKACRLLIIEKECGEVAMGAELEILQKTESSKSCGRLSLQLLPHAIRLIKEEDKKDHKFSRWFQSNRSLFLKSQAQ